MAELHLGKLEIRDRLPGCPVGTPQPRVQYKDLAKDLAEVRQRLERLERLILWVVRRVEKHKPLPENNDLKELRFEYEDF